MGARGGLRKNNALNFNVTPLLEALETAVTNSSEEIANRISYLAKAKAPFDKGNLEKAITIKRPKNQKRGLLGLFEKKRWSITVDKSYPAGGNKKVGDYASIVHDYLEIGDSSSGRQLFYRDAKGQTHSASEFEKATRMAIAGLNEESDLSRAQKFLHLGEKSKEKDAKQTNSHVGPVGGRYMERAWNDAKMFAKENNGKAVKEVVKQFNLDKLNKIYG